MHSSGVEIFREMGVGGTKSGGKGGARGLWGCYKNRHQSRGEVQTSIP